MRAPLYKKSYCDKLVYHMNQGSSFESFGSIVNAGKTVLYEWVEIHEEFKSAKEVGESKALNYWENIAKAAAIGKDIKVNGEKCKPKAKSAEFFLATRFNDIYGRKNTHKHEVGQSFENLKSKSDQELIDHLMDIIKEDKDVLNQIVASADLLEFA